MADYRRFIAYVYEYTQRKKGNGKGFIKVEARNGVCRMNFKLEGVSGRREVPARVYGYVRINGRARGIYLGTCDLAGSAVQFQLEMSQEDLGDSGYGLGDLRGLVLVTDTGETYGSGWEEQPLRIDEIEFPEPTYQRKEREEVEVREERKEEGSEEGAAEGPEEMDTKIVLEEETEGTESGTWSEQKEKEPMDRNAEAVPEDTRDQDIRKADKEGQGSEQEKDSGEDGDQSMEEGEMAGQSAALDRGAFQPFFDGGILDCRKIMPYDFRRLGIREQGLLNNPFLRHGLDHYGHLLLGKREEDGRWILGVPGCYERQEGIMAGMFGFPFFKVCRTPERSRKFGYWYRLIELGRR